MRCKWLEQAEKQLQAIANLPRGWDSYGALPPDPEKLAVALAMLRRLCQADLPKPHVNPTPAGGVQFEWEAGQRYFEIEVEGADEISCFWSNEATGDEEERTIPESQLLDAVLRYVRRLEF